MFDIFVWATGKSWQRTLYHSIDGSRCMLALISEPYLKSAVCQEEFALAQAKHFAKVLHMNSELALMEL